MDRCRPQTPSMAIGATLLDTVVCVGCAAALVAVAVPGLSAMRGGSMTALNEANLATIGAAAQSWSADNDGWIVGSPATSGRDLLNDADATASLMETLDLPYDATQPFDWAGPLAWSYIAPEVSRPDRRDARFVMEYGANPDAPTEIIDGPLSVFADPAQSALSAPYAGVTLPAGVNDTYFQTQRACSYLASREFLWWQSSTDPSTPRWASASYWGNLGVIRGTSEPRLPGAGVNELFSTYRPYMARVGTPSRKVQIADGARYQAPSLQFIDHDVDAMASFGGAFADSGAWDVNFSRAYGPGNLLSGASIVGNSFRREKDGEPGGNVLYFDGSVQLLTITEARNPQLWLPRGASLRINTVAPEYQSTLPTDQGGYVLIW